MQLRSYDVIVIGGGVAGVSAAVSAARVGASVLLVERHPYVGGGFTAGMVLHICGLIDHRLLCASDPRILDPANWVVKGLAIELHDRLKAVGAAQGPQWDHERGKIVLDDLLDDAGVKVLYGTQCHAAAVADGRIVAVECIYRTHKLRLEAKVFVDASGDGDLGAAAGVSFEFGRGDGGVMPATLSFLVGDGDPDTGEDLNEALIRGREMGMLSSEAHAGLIDYRFAEDQVRREHWCSPVRQWGDMTDPWDYSRMERRARQVAWAVFLYLKEHSRSWADAYLASMGHQLWPREGRHLAAAYCLTSRDVLAAARFDDAIARGAFYLDLHAATPGAAGWEDERQREETNGYFEVPYRSLVAVGVENLLLAGRTIGADHVGYSATRVMGTGIATGQAAGVAGAILARAGGPAIDIGVAALREILTSQGVEI